MSTEDTLSDENTNDREETPLDYEEIAKRFAWFNEVIDKQLDRFDSIIRGNQQKATWTLATSTGFIALASFTKGNAMSMTIRSILSNLFNQGSTSIPFLDCLAVVIAFLLVCCYLRLLHRVVHVYFPRRMQYPYPLWSKESNFPEDVLEEDERYKSFVEESWEYAIDNYIIPDELEINRTILEEYIPIYIKHIATLNSLEIPVERSFDLMLVIAYLSCALIFIA